MAWTFSPDDQAVLDAQEVVTFVSVVAGGLVEHEVAVADAVRNNLSTREAAASLGKYQSGDVVWEIGRSSLDGYEPKPRDRVEDAFGGVFTVLDAMDDRWANYYRLTSRNLAVAYDLRDAVDYYEPRDDQATDAAGFREPDFAPVALGLAASVHETGRETRDVMGKRVTEVEYEVRLEVRRPVSHEGQFHWTPIGEHDERILEVRSTTDPDTIDALQAVRCVWRDDA